MPQSYSVSLNGRAAEPSLVNSRRRQSIQVVALQYGIDNLNLIITPLVAAPHERYQRDILARPVAERRNGMWFPELDVSYQ